MVPLPGATGYVARAVRTWAGGFAIVSAWGGEGDRKSAVWVSPDGETMAPGLAGFGVVRRRGRRRLRRRPGRRRKSGPQRRGDWPRPLPSPRRRSRRRPSPRSPPSPPRRRPRPSRRVARRGLRLGLRSRRARRPSPSPIRSPAAGVRPTGLQWFRGSGMGGPYAQSMTSVTQAFDSLVAVSSAPGDLPGLAAAPSGDAHALDHRRRHRLEADPDKCAAPCRAAESFSTAASWSWPAWRRAARFRS